MKNKLAKFVVGLSCIAAVALTGLWIEGMFFLDELRINSRTAGVRLHWSDGVLVVVGMHHANGPDYPGWNFWHFPRSETFAANGSGFQAPRSFAGFGFINSSRAGSMSLGVTMPIGAVIACLIALTTVYWHLCQQRSRNSIDQLIESTAVSGHE